MINCRRKLDPALFKLLFRLFLLSDIDKHAEEKLFALLIFHQFAAQMYPLNASVSADQAVLGHYRRVAAGELGTHFIVYRRAVLGIDDGGHAVAHSHKLLPCVAEEFE